MLYFKMDFTCLFLIGYSKEKNLRDFPHTEDNQMS